MRSLAATLGFGLVLAGCTLVGSGATGSPTRPQSAAPTPTSTASPTPTEASGLAVPPAALLTQADGGQHEGTLGTFCYRDGCADAPYWPTAASMTRVELAGGDEMIVVRLPAELRVSYWQARYAARDDHFAGTVWPLGSQGEVDGRQVFVEAWLPAPPSGEWLLNVGIFFPGGDAQYYWFVSMP